MNIIHFATITIDTSDTSDTNDTNDTIGGGSAERYWDHCGRPILLTSVTLSEAKGLSRWAQRCFAEFTLSEAKGSA
jgi:hypothetical protein